MSGSRKVVFNIGVRCGKTALMEKFKRELRNDGEFELSGPSCEICQLFKSNNRCSLLNLNAKPTDYCSRFVPKNFPFTGISNMGLEKRICIFCDGTGAYKRWFEVSNSTENYCYQCGTFSTEKIPGVKKKNVGIKCPICESKKHKKKINNMYECVDCGEIYWKELSNIINGTYKEKHGD